MHPFWASLPNTNAEAAGKIELVQLIIPDEQPCFDLTQIWRWDETPLW